LTGQLCVLVLDLFKPAAAERLMPAFQIFRGRRSAQNATRPRRHLAGGPSGHAGRRRCATPTAVQMFGQMYLSNGGNRDALRGVEGRQVSGQCPVDPPEPCGWVRATASSTSSEGLAQWNPLHEPDHFIDARKLLAKSGSPSRRHPMHCRHRYQLRSLTLQGRELSLDRRWPPAFDGDDRPPSLRKERTH
jgi:hypothetical protein